MRLRIDRLATAVDGFSGAVSRGFTLLEMLVVLVLIGLVLTLSAPRLEAVYRSLNFALTREQFRLSLQDLPRQALASGRPLVIDRLDAGDARELGVELAADWKVEITEPLMISAQGFCSGGRFTLEDGRSRAEYRLQQPHCLVEELPP